MAQSYRSISKVLELCGKLVKKDLRKIENFSLGSVYVSEETHRQLKNTGSARLARNNITFYFSPISILSGCDQQPTNGPFAIL
jgi:hypothetical protein